MNKTALITLLTLSLSATAQADDAALGREFYDSLVQCAAFHTVESGMAQEGGDAAASHLATANDYRNDARKHAIDGQPASADTDIQTAIALYRKMIAEGDAQDMAESWTQLESACRELHSVKAQLGQKTTENAR